MLMFLESQPVYNYYKINFHLDMMLDILNYPALDINFVIMSFVGYSLILVTGMFSFIFLLYAIYVLYRYILVDFISYFWCLTLQ